MLIDRMCASLRVGLFVSSAGTIFTTLLQRPSDLFSSGADDDFPFTHFHSGVTPIFTTLFLD
jgi:hypothetical protein